MKIQKKDIIYGLIFSILLFNNIFAAYIPGFNYMDELIFLYSAGYIVGHKSKIREVYFEILVMVGLIVIIGIAGNIMWDFNNGNIVIIKDIIAFLKMPVTMTAFSMMSENKKTEDALSIAYTCSKLFILILFFCFIIAVITNNGMIYETRKGLPSYRFVFVHPTFMVYALTLMLTTLVAHGIKRKDYVFHIMALILLFFSLRDKAFALIGVYLVIVILMPNIKKINIFHILIFASVSIGLTYDKIALYKSFPWSPRAGMYITGMVLMKKCFPIGSGFGTFASNLSGEYYSRLYILYGFNEKGITPSNYSDLGDAGIPYYYSQFGFFGMMLFCFILLYLYKLVCDKCIGYSRQAAFILLAYIMIALVVENFFVNETGVTSMVFLFTFIASKKTVSRNKKREYEDTILWIKAQEC